jgi:hypothetical protein
MNKRTGITIGGTKYFMGFSLVSRTGSGRHHPLSDTSACAARSIARWRCWIRTDPGQPLLGFAEVIGGKQEV